MLAQFAVVIPTLPVDQCHSHFIHFENLAQAILAQASSSLLCGFFFCSWSTARDASQGMEHRPRWLGADHPRASLAFGELAQSWPRISRPSSEVEPSPVVRRLVATSVAISSQSSARGCRRGSQETCRGDRDRIGSIGGSGHDRWPRGSGVEGLPHESEAICTRTTSRRPDQPDGVAPRKGKEEADCTRCRTPDIGDGHRAERRTSRTSPSSCSRSRCYSPTAPSSRRGDSSARTPTDGESAPGGARRVCSRVAWNTHGAPQGQAEIVTCTPKWSNPSHAHVDSVGPQRLDAGTPWRSAGGHECRQQWEDPRVDINVVERCREDGRDDRRSDNAIMIEERRHSRYGLRGVRIGEASHPGPRLLRRYPGGFCRVHDVSSDEEPLIPSSRNVVPRLSGVDSTIPATPRALVQVGRELSPAVTEAETVLPPPTPEVSREQGDVFQTGVTVVDMSSNDTDQEEVGEQVCSPQ